MLTKLTSGREYAMYSDASKNGLRSVLMQDGKVVAYASRQLKPHVTPYPDEVHSICNCRGTYVHQVPL